MRLHAALHIPTTLWHLSNAFSSPNAVESWISEQPMPSEYVPIACDIQGTAWQQVKNSLDYLSNNTCISARTEVHATEVTEQRSEAQQVVKQVVKPPFAYSTEDLTNFKDELVALEKKLEMLEQEIVALNKKEQDEDYGSIQSGIKTRLLAELAGLTSRHAYVSAQIPADPVELPKATATGASGQTPLQQRMAALNNNKT